MTSKPLVSIIIPTFKETNLVDTLFKLESFLQNENHLLWEILIVDDSPNDDFNLLSATISSSGLKYSKLLRGQQNGKGGAVRVGASQSMGDPVFFMDADLPVPMEKIPQFVQLQRDRGFDAVIAERVVKRNIKTPLRFTLSLGLLIIQQAWVFNSREFIDTQCGFKLFRRDVLKKITDLQRVNAGLFDIEYLYICIKNNLRVGKVQVIPELEMRPSRLSIHKILIRAPVDLLQMKWMGWIGRYSFSKVKT